MKSAARTKNDSTGRNAGKRIDSHNNGYRVNSVSEISAVFSKLSKSRALLTVTMTGIDREFGSVILEVNRDKNYLVLDELFPGGYLKESLQDRKLYVETQLEGIEVRFSVTVNAVATRDGIEYYRAEFPPYIHHRQRRESYRVNIGVTDAVPMALSTANDVLLHAELRDISLGGVSARIQSPMGDVLTVGDEIPTCVIHTPDGTKIVGSLEIARIDNTQAKQYVRIGARFRRLSPRDRQELSRLIAQLDRENIKKLRRVSGDR